MPRVLAARAPERSLEPMDGRSAAAGGRRMVGDAERLAALVRSLDARATALEAELAEAMRDADEGWRDADGSAVAHGIAIGELRAAREERDAALTELAAAKELYAFTYQCEGEGLDRERTLMDERDALRARVVANMAVIRDLEAIAIELRSGAHEGHNHGGAEETCGDWPCDQYNYPLKARQYLCPHGNLVNYPTGHRCSECEPARAEAETLRAALHDSHMRVHATDQSGRCIICRLIVAAGAERVFTPLPRIGRGEAGLPDRRE